MLVWKGRIVRVRLPKASLLREVSLPKAHEASYSSVSVQTRLIFPETVSISKDDINISIPDAVLWDWYVGRVRESTLESLGISSRTASDFSLRAHTLQSATPDHGWVHDWTLPSPSLSPPRTRLEKRKGTISDTAAEVAMARVNGKKWSRESSASDSSAISPTHAVAKQLAVPSETPKEESSAKRLSRLRPATPYMNPQADAFTPASGSTISGPSTDASTSTTVKVIRPPGTDVLAKMQSLQIDTDAKYRQPSIHHSLHPFGLGISPDFKPSRTPAPSLAMVPPSTGVHGDEADYLKAQLARCGAPTPETTPTDSMFHVPTKGECKGKPAYMERQLVQYELTASAWKSEKNIYLKDGADQTLAIIPYDFVTEAIKTVDYLLHVAHAVVNCADESTLERNHQRVVSSAQLLQGEYVLSAASTTFSFTHGPSLISDVDECIAGSCALVQDLREQLFQRDGQCMLTGERQHDCLVLCPIVPYSLGQQTVDEQVGAEGIHALHSLPNSLLLCRQAAWSFTHHKLAFYATNGKVIAHCFGVTFCEYHGKEVTLQCRGPDARLLQWHYTQCVKARFRGFYRTV